MPFTPREELTMIEEAPMIMLFGRPIFHKGLNLTVRNGDKWFRQLDVGQEFRIESTGEFDVTLTATCVGKSKCQFGTITADALQYEHDPRCREYGALLAEMIAVYGLEFTPNSPVTLIWFVA